tara:strand:- start:4933 stop:6069 length:1137 start_codon:yes stop_codon:yes gene_type:complete
MKKIFIFLFIFFFYITNINANTDKEELYKKIDLFAEVLEKIKKEYVDEVDQSELIDNAINGALQSLDPYSSYMDIELFDSMQTDTKGEFGGLGIEVGMEAGVVKVVAPIDDTPAAKAGIKAGDYIVKINGTQVQGKSLMEAVKLMRGPVGSTIDLTIRRKGVKKAINKTIRREIIEIKSVESKVLKEKVGYLRLKSFNSNSGKQLVEEIKNIEKKKKPKGYILDLRNNPGGLLTQAIDVTNFFLSEGEIVSTRGRKAIENRRFFARKGDRINGKPLIVLINNGSASASEIVAGALKDHKRAIILGSNTYGKGSVQSIIPLNNGGGIRITISKYYLPSGQSISEVGVTPDIFVDDDDEDFEIDSITDSQLNYALKLLTT